MGFDQYHEPADELNAETRTFARIIASFTEEAEAIGWYQQRISLEPDSQARAIMENAQSEEFKHFGMDLEFLLRRTPKWRVALQTILSVRATSSSAGSERRTLKDSADARAASDAHNRTRTGDPLGALTGGLQKRSPQGQSCWRAITRWHALEPPRGGQQCSFARRVERKIEAVCLHDRCSGIENQDRALGGE
jgi:uncharacterized protein